MNTGFIYSLVLFHLISKCSNWVVDYDRDADLSLDELIKKFGHGGLETYPIQTRDGYLLNIFRIKRSNASSLMPVILVHGMSACAMTFFSNKKISPPIVFADNDFDVWLINSRGTEPSRGHVRWNSSTDRLYWNFGWEEIASIDLTATIDLVLQHSEKEKVILVGHSEGSTVLFVTLMTAPEYNDKVSLAVHFAVSAYHDNCASVPLIRPLCSNSKLVEYFLGSLDMLSLYPTPQIRITLRDTCRYTVFRPMCKEMAKVFFQMDEQLDHIEDPSFFMNLVLCGGSTREMYHYLQVGATNRFAKFDYGPQKNLKIYNSTEPPLYDWSNIRVPQVLYCGGNDVFCSKRDIDMLVSQLVNVDTIYLDFKGKKSAAHDEYLIAKDVQKNVFNDVLPIMRKHSV